MKKVFLYAYDKQNLGDDLFIETIVTRYPKIKFYLWSDKKNKKNFSCFSNLKIIDKDSWIVQLLNKIRPSLSVRYKAYYLKKATVHVYIGGSIFMEYPTWENIVNWWKYQVERYNFYVLGANFGPYKTEHYKDGMAEVFSKMKDICFRDQYSHQLFQNIDTVRWAPDILFAYPHMPKPKKIKKQLFISPIQCSDKNDSKLKRAEETYLAMWENILKEYAKQGYQFVFASFCKEEGDINAIQNICRRMDEWISKDNYCILEYNGRNQENILEAMAESEYILASRFHAAILGMAARRPVFPIIYSDKTKYVLEDMNFQGNYADIRDLEGVDFVYSKQNLDDQIIMDVEILKEKAEEHFRVLDQQLKEN